METEGSQAVVVVVDTDEVGQTVARAGVPVHWRGTVGDAEHLGVSWQSCLALPLAELYSQQLGNPGPQAVAQDHQLVLLQLHQLLHQLVQHLLQDVGAGQGHPLVSHALVEGNVVSVEIHQNVRHTRHGEHLGAAHRQHHLLGGVVHH